MAIQRRSEEQKEALFTVGLNITLQGSKKMSVEEQDRLMEEAPDAVEIIIRDAKDGYIILISKTLLVVEFSTGSVGYKFHARGETFRRSR